MKKQLILSALLIPLFFQGLPAQDVPGNLDGALASYQTENLENTRFLLQEALNGINQEIGKKILEKLPEEMKGMPYNRESDNVTGASSGFASLFVNREYKGEATDASVQIISDSPMLAGINAILTMPGFMTSGPDQKRIKIDNYKALMSKSQDESGRVSWSIQMPFNNSLLTFECSGISSEQEVMEMADQIPVSEIVAIAQ